ncbi:hypothetical protein N8590_02950 [bacterium]|nr:hypothetical protein [bacterium]
MADCKVYDTNQLAKTLGCSPRHVATMDADGLLPTPIRLGRLKKWSVSVIDQWLAAGSPDRATFESGQP